MSTKKKLTMLATAIGVTLGSLSLGAAPAMAAPAPSCVNAHYVPVKKHVFVQNTCSQSVRVKVIWAFGSDSACTTIGGTAANGTAPYRTFKRPLAIARWDGIVNC